MRARALVGVSVLGLLLILLLTATKATSAPLESVAAAASSPAWSEFQPSGWVAGPLTTCSVRVYNQDGLMELGRYITSTDGGASWSGELNQGLTVALDSSHTTAFLTVTNLSFPESLTANRNQIRFFAWTLPLQLQEPSPTYVVRVDASAPSSVVNTTGCYGPTWPGAIRGTASDSGSGVSRVDITLRRNSDNRYYNGTSWQLTSVWLATTGTVSWSYPFTPGEDTYLVQSRATDAVGHQQGVYGQGTFTYDLSAPVSTVETTGYFNEDTWAAVGVIVGSAYDAASGVASVKITVRRLSDGLYYNGSSWSTTVTWLSVSGTTAWSFPFTPSVQTTYVVQSWATNNCGNVQSVPGQAAFTYDTTPPQSSVATGGCFGAASWAGAITGSASDAVSGVARVEITLQRASDGRYYNGSSWGSTATWLSASGTTSWSYAFTPSVDTTYAVNSRAVDNAGNAQTAYGTGSFTYDSTAPGAPFNLSVTPSGWSRDNFFYLTWSNPTDLCGIASAHYKWDAEPTSNNDESPGSPVAEVGIDSISGLAVPTEGDHRLCLWLEDSAGNVNFLSRNCTSPAAFRWDTTPPVTSIASVSGTQGCAGWYTSTVQVNISAVDATSGISATFWRQDGGSWQQVPGSAFQITGEGAHTVEYYSVDRAGNTETPEVLSPQVKIDTAPPTTQQPGYAGTLGNDGWYRSPVSVMLSASDPTSGVSVTYHQVNTGTLELGDVFDVVADGEHTIHYYSVDVACNQEALQTAATPLKIDQTPPTTTYQLDGLLGENGWFIASPVTVTLSASDETSGLDHVRYRVEGGSWQQTSDPVVTTTVSLLGQTERLRNVEYYATDLAGNAEPQHSLPVGIDFQPPPTIPIIPAVSPSWWTNTNCFTITWDVNPSDVSGIGGAYYSFTEPISPTDGTPVIGDDIKSIACIQVPDELGEGAHNLYVWLRDRAGNSNHLTRRTVTVRLDQTPPEAVAIVDGNMCGGVGWYNSCVTVTFVATDNVPGGMVGGVISYHVNSGDWVEGYSYVECRDGFHGVECRARDAAGNSSDVFTAPLIKLDRTAPNAPRSIQVEPAGWTHKNSFTITWGNPTDLSGLAGVCYKQGSIPVSSTDGICMDGIQSSLSISATTEGQLPVYVWLKDRACNSDHQNRAVATLKYDSTPPTTTPSVSCTTNYGWCISAAQISLTVEDLASGWGSSRYRIGSGPWQSGTLFTVDAEGVVAFSYYSIDAAGNIEDTQTASVKIDREPPSSYAYADSYSPTTSFTVYWDGSDASSGIACFDVQYRIGANGIWQDWVSCVEPAQTSRLFDRATHGRCYYFRSRARDRAGHVEPYPSESDVYVCVDLVQNGDFEFPLGGEWETKWPDGACRPARVYTESFSGGNTWATVLGCPDRDAGVPFGESMICQTIAVPGAQSWPAPVLRFRYRIFTYDVLWSTYWNRYYDSFNVGLGLAGAVQPTYVFTDGNRDSDKWNVFMDLGWREGTVDLSPYAGQTMKVCLANVTRVDTAYNTWTIVDDVRLVNLEYRLYVPVILRTAAASGLSSEALQQSMRPRSKAER
jgi:hypothetical protein